jgi:hypothetical protein
MPSEENMVRRKLGPYGLRIETMVNVGYRLMLPPEAQPPASR